MVLVAIFLITAGFTMLIKPGFVWRISEKWKSSGAEEPSLLYIWSIRFGGILCTLAGMGSLIAYLLALNP